MWPPRRTLASCGAHVMLFCLLLQHHMMASQAATTVAHLKNLQHQPSTTLGQKQQQQQPQHQQQRVQSQLPLQPPHQPQQPALAAHPGETNDHMAIAKPTPSSSSSSSSSATSASAHLPLAKFVSEKETAVQEDFQHLSAEDDLNESYQILTELKHDGNVNNPLLLQPPPPAQPQPSPLSSFAMPYSSSTGNNYPWNIFERNPFAAPSPSFAGIPMPPIAGIFPHMFGAFEGYPTPFPVTPRFMPIMSYPQPILVPYPFYMTPEMLYPGFAGLSNGLQDYEDTMSRGASASRRPAVQQHSPAYSRNSPIYYVRLPPTPYMFMPGLELGASTSAMTGYPTMLPYQSPSLFPAFSSLFNVPINFLANGKPTSIYQMSGSPNDIQAGMPYSTSMATTYNNRLTAQPAPPPPPPPPLASSSAGGYRPLAHNFSNSNNPISSTSSSNGYGSYPVPVPGSTSTSASSSATSPSSQDSKLTSLKRPYYFNGRPEDIYILPNNYNSLYSSENRYY